MTPEQGSTIRRHSPENVRQAHVKPLLLHFFIIGGAPIGACFIYAVELPQSSLIATISIKDVGMRGKIYAGGINARYIVLRHQTP